MVVKGPSVADYLCIFCGKSPVTKEHLIPKWMIRLVQGQFDWEGGKAGVR